MKKTGFEIKDYKRVLTIKIVACIILIGLFVWGYWAVMVFSWIPTGAVK
jgi:hypothetical protein